ncbi:MAG TPA: hypothetical protein VFX16_37135 [Pseudonocardiaceae bacterium]|nr:hypothetical protein [Pseudonocardiaceae bacterium]
MSSTDTIVRTTGRSLIADELFTRLSERIATDHPDIDRGLAERIMDQASAFLAAVGSRAGEKLSPSKLVDIGWHTFILYTREYADYCERVAGGFIHHEPHDTPGAAGDTTCSVARTLAAISAAGYVPDAELWAAGDSAKCSDCSGSGANGDENTEGRIPPPVH